MSNTQKTTNETEKHPETHKNHNLHEQKHKHTIVSLKCPMTLRRELRDTCGTTAGQLRDNRGTTAGQLRDNCGTTEVPRRVFFSRPPHFTGLDMCLVFLIFFGGFNAVRGCSCCLHIWQDKCGPWSLMVVLGHNMARECDSASEEASTNLP